MHDDQVKNKIPRHKMTTWPYPLSPLTPTEQANAAAATIPKIESRYNPKTVASGEIIIDRLELLEPPKYQVLSFNKGGPRPPRKARVTFYIYKKVKYVEYQVQFDEKGNVIFCSDEHTIKGARASWNCSDEDAVSVAALESKKFRKALRKRGLTDYDIDNNIYFDVSVDGRLDNCKCQDCEGEAAVLKSKPENHTMYLTAFWNDGDKLSTAAYIQPIEGVYVLFDRTTNEILKVVDTGVIAPIQKGNLNWNRPVRPGLKPIVTTLPEGPSYTLTDDGYAVEWQGWNLRWGWNPVTGFILYQVSYQEYLGDIPQPKRDILYRANLTEFITGYASPDAPSKLRSYLDIHEYVARDFVPSLKPGIDAPTYADYFPVNYTGTNGKGFTVDNTVALYEQHANVAWRHVDYPCTCVEIDGEEVCTRHQGRVNRKLVLRVGHVIANYDYLLSWTFDLTGKINFDVEATGCLETAGTNLIRVPKSHLKHTGASLIKPYILGLNHLHMGSVRIDFMVDGLKNFITEHDTILEPVDKENPCGNVFDEEHKLLTSEKKAVRNADASKGRSWVIQSSSSKNETGHNRGYELIISPRVRPVIKDCARLSKRATYLNHDLFVTKYREGEFTPMGEYPVEKGVDEGLRVYIKNDENIVNEDIVVWATLGFAHAPVSEEYPVMNLKKFGLTLEPHDFFDQNPSMSISPENIEGA